MNIEEIKKFYILYQGLNFHMSREEPELYEAFKNLNLDQDTLKKWDEEIPEFLHFKWSKVKKKCRNFYKYGDLLSPKELEMMIEDINEEIEKLSSMANYEILQSLLGNSKEKNYVGIIEMVSRKCRIQYVDLSLQIMIKLINLINVDDIKKEEYFISQPIEKK